MWWSRRQVLGRAIVPTLVVLTGCGFTPMYGGRGRETLAEMSAIKIEPIPGRIGYFLHTDLVRRLTPRGEPRRPLYHLRVELARSKAPLAIQLDSTVTRFNLRLDATFTLIDARTDQALYRDRARAIGSYNAVRSDFATLTAEQDTERRGAREVSEEIRTLLSVYFARWRTASERPPQ